jgi:uncharacterized protein YllA (UPF0747 family)
MTSSFVSHDLSNVPSKVMKDLLEGGALKESFGISVPDLDSFKKMTQSLALEYSSAQRNVLIQALVRQNENLNSSEEQSIEALRKGAFTITTGHQLMVCGGTVFFEAKILGAVALAKKLSEKLQHPVVPIFWMASEDHDFEEIASFKIGSNKFSWKLEETGGPVGRLHPLSLGEQLRQWLQGVKINAAQRALLEPRIKAYESSATLADATRMWVRQWAEGLGLLVIDGDDQQLKAFTAPIWKAELEGEFAQVIQRQTSDLKALGFKAQVFPREINLFSLENNSRDRILQKPQTLPAWHDISPNALLRPLYQEYLLPNLAYVGGGGELAYWLQLVEAFKLLHRSMPILYLRNSLVLENPEMRKAAEKLNVSYVQLLTLSSEDLKKTWQGLDLELSAESNSLNQPILQSIEEWNMRLVELYPELRSHADALQTKMLKLAARTKETRYRIQKRRHAVHMQSIDVLYDNLYPKGTFWERTASYTDLVGELGIDPRDYLVEKMSTIKAGTLVLHSEK